MRRLFIVCCIIITYTTRGIFAARKLPTGIKPCSRNDAKLNECLVKNANIAMPLLANGVPSFGLPKYEPLEVHEIHIDDSGSKRSLAVNLKMFDVKFHGLKDKYLTTASVDLKNNKITWKGIIPKLRLIGTYDINGKVLILPIVGKGPMDITLSNIEFNYGFKIRHETKNGKVFAIPFDSTLTFVAGGANIRLDGLFNGDKRLGDHMNVFLNENWKELIGDIGGPISEVLNAAATNMITRVFSMVPYDSVFPE